MQPGGLEKEYRILNTIHQCIYKSSIWVLNWFYLSPVRLTATVNKLHIKAQVIKFGFQTEETWAVNADSVSFIPMSLQRLSILNVTFLYGSRYISLNILPDYS